MLPPRTVVHIEASNAARRYTAAQLERERAVASAMAHHPSTGSVGVDAPPPRDTPTAEGDAAASPSPFSACHATVTSLNDAVDRLRLLRDGRDE